MQAVNFNSYEQDVTVVIKSNGGPISFEDSAVLHHVSGAHGEAENSFDLPDNVTLCFSDNVTLCFPERTTPQGREHPPTHSSLPSSFPSLLPSIHPGSLERDRDCGKYAVLYCWGR
jgi:hypothetical protein